MVGKRPGAPIQATAIASVAVASSLFVVTLAAAVARPGLWTIGVAGAVLLVLLERLIAREDELRRRTKPEP